MKKWLGEFLDATFWRFILVGVVNTLFGTAIMFAFYNLWHFSYWFSSASNYVLASILSYFLNKHFTFQSKDNSPRSVLRFAANITVCYLAAYGAAKPLIRYLLAGQSATLQDNIAMLAGMCIFVALNYCGQRFFVFRKTAQEEK